MLCLWYTHKMSTFSSRVCLLLFFIIVCGLLSTLYVLQEEQHEFHELTYIPEDYCYDFSACTDDLEQFPESKQLGRQTMEIAQTGSLFQLIATFLLLLAPLFGTPFSFESMEGGFHQKNTSVWAVCLLISSIVASFVLFVLLYARLQQSLAVSFTMNSKLINLKVDDKMPLPCLRDGVDEGRMSETSPCGMGVQLKGNLMMKISGKKWRKEESFLDTFSKPTFNHIFKFRRDQVFKQTSTVCPAAVSLVSHFASGTYGQPGSIQDLKKEGVRLASFKDFPTNIPISAMRLAQAGFHYTGERDVVKCFSCGVTYQGWQMGDRPTLVHKRISPNCPFVQNSDAINLPLPLPVTSRPDFSGTSSLDSGYGSHSFESLPGVPSGGMPNGTVSSDLHEDSGE